MCGEQEGWSVEGMDCKGAAWSEVEVWALLSGVDRRRLTRHLHPLQACWVKGADEWERWEWMVSWSASVGGLASLGYSICCRRRRHRRHRRRDIYRSGTVKGGRESGVAFIQRSTWRGISSRVWLCVNTECGWLA